MFKYSILALTIAISANAGPAKKAQAKAQPVAPPVVIAQPEARETASAESTATVHKHHSAKSIAVGLGMMRYSSTNSYGINASILMLNPIESQPLSVGLDLGVYRNSQDILGTSVATYTIPVMATAVYQLEQLSVGRIHPFIGASAGMGIVHVRSAANKTEYYFQGMIRPGVEMGLSDSVVLTAEPKFGILKDEFVFNPSVNALLSF